MAAYFDPLGFDYAPPAVSLSSCISIDEEMMKEEEDIVQNDPRTERLSVIDGITFGHLLDKKRRAIQDQLTRLLDSGITAADLRAEVDRGKELLRKEANSFLTSCSGLSESRREVDAKMDDIAQRMMGISLSSAVSQDNFSVPHGYIGGALGWKGGSAAYNVILDGAASAAQKALAKNVKAQRDFVVATAKVASASVPLDVHTWIDSLGHPLGKAEWAKESAKFTLEQSKALPQMLKSELGESFYLQVERDLQQIAEITKKNVHTTLTSGFGSRNLPIALRAELLRSIEGQERSFEHFQATKQGVSKATGRLVAIQRYGKILPVAGLGLGLAAAVLAPEAVLATGVIVGALTLAGSAGRVVGVTMSALTYYFFLPDEAQAPTE